MERCPSIYQIAFASLKGISVETANEIIATVGSEEDFFRISGKDLQRLSGANSKIFDESYRAGLLENARHEQEFIASKRITAFYFTDKDYPARLLNAPDAPLLLYSAGNCDLNAAKIVSVVGTRHATAYGAEQCRNLISGLKEQTGDNVVIVSGLAYGIDVTAHHAALEYGLPTVAVVAHGLNMIYPAQHRQTAADIIKNGGAIVTEYPSGTRIHRSNFLSRNRIIAALADCTVVVESAKKGGALVTANIASSYGRDVFAYPGRVSDEYSEGCNNLITKNVAALITSADDLISLMCWEKRKDKPVQQQLFVELTAEEETVCDLLSGRDFMTINELGATTRMPVHKLLSILVDMEFRGIVQSLPGNRYKLLHAAANLELFNQHFF